MSRSRRFNFKDLDVYQAALAYFRWAVAVLTELERPPFVLQNQIIGAAMSIMANIGEANGRDRRPGEVEQHYRYAQGSVYESAAYLDALAALGAIDRKTHEEREEQLARIAAMLTRLIQKQARRRSWPVCRPSARDVPEPDKRSSTIDDRGGSQFDDR